MNNQKSALAAHTKKPAKSRGKKRDKTQLDITCNNCKRPGHGKTDCYSKGGGKKGQGPQQGYKPKPKESKMVVVTADDEENKMFAFTCMSDYIAVVDNLDIPKSRLAVDRKITTADGRMLNAVGMGDLQLKLPNRKIKTNMVFENAIYAPEMAFMLISISRLDKVGFAVNFKRGMCSISNPKGKTVATIPHSDGRYKITAAK